MSPPGPPYNIPPTDEDSRSPNVVPSGQIHSEQLYDESFVTMDDPSIDAMSLQETGDTGPSSMVNFIPNQNPYPSLVTHESIPTSSDPNHYVQHASTTTGGTYGGAQGIGSQSSSHDERHQFHTCTKCQRQMVETVQATDGAGIQYQIRQEVMNPKMAKYEERLHTYSHWRRDFFISRQKAASAGLYCVEGTYLVCFACGGGLDHWEPKDDPLREHTRLYKECPYVAAVLVERFLVRSNTV